MWVSTAGAFATLARLERKPTIKRSSERWKRADVRMVCPIHDVMQQKCPPKSEGGGKKSSLSDEY
jgi:hypothetical protein